MADTQIEPRPSAELPEIVVAGADPDRRMLVSRRTLAAGTSAAALVPVLLGGSGLWAAACLLFSAMLVATALTSSSREFHSSGPAWLSWLPASLLLLLAASTAVGLVAAALEVSVWGSRPVAAATWTALNCVALTVALRRGGQVVVATNRLIVSVFALSLSLLPVLVLTQPFGDWSRIANRGTDFSRHVAMVIQTAHDGWLDYGTDAYPRSVHAALALVLSAAGVPDHAEAWRATEGLLLIMFSLMAAAAAALAAAIARRLTGTSRLVPCAAVLVWLITVLGPWAQDILPSGFLTSFEAGLIIAASALLWWEASERDSPPTAVVVVLLGLVALMAHTWLLLAPIVAVPALILAWRLWRFERSARTTLLIAAIVAGLLSLPIVLASFFVLGPGAASTPGSTTLPGLGAPWILLLALTGICVSALSRRGGMRFAGATAGMLISFLFLLVFLMSQWDHTTMGTYYLIKSAWTPMPVLAALAVPAALWLIWRAAAPWRWTVTGALALVLAIVAVPFAGPAFRVYAGSAGEPAIVIPMLDQLNTHFAGPQGWPPDLLVWGLSPQLDSPADVASVGTLDLIAQGALVFTGQAQASDARPFTDHDPVATCAYLRQHPGTVGVTGPNPQGAISWLIDSGCPIDVVKPSAWVSIKLPTAMFSDDETAAGGYLTWAAGKSAQETPAQ